MTGRQDGWQQPEDPQQDSRQQDSQAQPWQPRQYDPVLHAERMAADGQNESRHQLLWPRYSPDHPPTYAYRQHHYAPQSPPEQSPPPQSPPEQSSPEQGQSRQGQRAPVPPQQPLRRGPSWPVRHKVLSGLIAVASIGIIAAVASSSNSPSQHTANGATPTTRIAAPNNTAAATNTAAAGSTTGARSATEATNAPSPMSAVSTAPASTAPSTRAATDSTPMTASQQQAVDAAQDYLSEGQGFSEQGLLDQLTSSDGNGFSKSDAEFAISDLHPNWDQQAVDSAQSYLNEGQGFSEQGLLQQLTSSAGAGFTDAQAEYAINSLHPDWDAQAVEAAKSYLQLGGFSQSSLMQQLTSSYGAGFTEAQAEYAVGQVGL